MDSIGFSMFLDHVICGYSFTSSFPISILFIFVSCLIVLTRTVSKMLNRNGESEHPCLISDLRGTAFILLLLNMVVTDGCFIDTVYQLEEISFNSYLFSVSS